MTHPYRDSTSGLLAAGYSPIPILPGEKRPAVPAWQRACTAPLPSEVVERFCASTTSYGVGLALGYRGLVAVDIDTDDEAIVAIIRSVVVPSSIAKIGRRGRTDFYIDRSGNLPSRRLLGANGMVVEILARGCQTVIPPTIHPDTGTPYLWLGGMTMPDVNIHQLPTLPPESIQRLEHALEGRLARPPVRPLPAPSIRTADFPLDAIEHARQQRYAQVILDRELALLAVMARDSGRNGAVFRLSCRIGRWCHAGVLSSQLVVAAIFEACNANGLLAEDGAKSVMATIASGFKTSASDTLPNLGSGARGGKA